MKFGRSILVFLGALSIGAAAHFWKHPASRAHGSLSQQAYIWQRAWTSAVSEAASTSSKQFSAYVALAGEVSFHSGEINTARVALDYRSLRATGMPIGLALRIGPYRGKFSSNDSIALKIENLAASLLTEAKAAGVEPAELQIDFDAGESQLGGYRLWIEAIKKRVAPVHVTITALPSWFASSEFPSLVRASDGYVLQVHSLNRPLSVDAPMTLCDPAAARRWVEQAGRIGAAFRVALPTYGYLVAFDDNGRFVGLSAEGNAMTWPRATQVKTLSADPLAMAGLVSAWTADRPACMAGIIWYRLPVADDTLNWRLKTLQTVMAGQSPQADVRAVVVKSEANLYEIQLQNEGDADAKANAQVNVNWENADLVADDAIGGFEKNEQAGRVIFRATPSIALERLAPGDRRVIGWVRLSTDTEVHADVSQINP
jgi:hypothetical protein